MILLALPPFKEGVRSTRWGYTTEAKTTLYVPFFLAYATSLLEKNGFEVDLVDAVASSMDKKEFVKYVRKRNPELLVMEMSTLTSKFDLELAKTIKEEVACKIAFTGPHATVLTEKILQHPYVDFVLRGEYEFTLLELAKKLRTPRSDKTIKGLAFRLGTKVILNKSRPLIANLDLLPFPARHFLPMEKYNEGFAARPNQQMITSRGCPFKCVFCVYPQVFYNHKVRTRSAKNVVDEMEFLIENYEPKEIYFDDDVFTIIPNHVLAVCQEIKKRRLDIAWSCMGHALVSERVLKAMVKAGCVGIKFGVETASPLVMKKIKKFLNLEAVKDFVTKAKKYGLRTHATYMIGLPGDTKETIEQTLKFAVSLGTDSFQVSIATPYPGTEFYERAKRNGWLVTDDFGRYDGNKESVISYPWLTKEEIDREFKKAKDLISTFDLGVYAHYFQRVYEDRGILGVCSFLIRKSPSYLLRLIRKQLFKLRIRKAL
jgi:radical SAM superfamily enzyme YgiQ (UPF0313 family)